MGRGNERRGSRLQPFDNRERGIMAAATTTTRARRAGAQVADVTAGESRQVARQAAGEAQQVASSAAERGGALVHDATDEARQLAGSVKARAGQVTGELVDEGRSLAEEARSQLESQASAGADRLAGALRELGEEAQALAEGRPEGAPTLSEYVWRAADGCYGAADRLHSLAGDIETRGFGGVLDDVQGFARRRPGTFLLGAALVGFGVGRWVRAEAADRQDAEAESAPVRPGLPNGRRAALPSRTAADRR
jgi:hypothetical protein